jgi:class 3 adenylate cyclase
MLKLRFRSKLILAMTLVVLGVTTVMLVVTRDRIQEAYAKVFSDQFQTQLDFVTERQQQRLEDLADICQQAAKSQAFIKAFTSEDPGASAKEAEAEIFRLATTPLPHQQDGRSGLLQGLLPEVVPSPSLLVPRAVKETKGPLRRLLNQEVSVIVLDSKGAEIPRSDGGRPLVKDARDAKRIGAGTADTRRSEVKFTEESLIKLVRSKRADRPREQKTGFTVIGDDKLKELVITPIRAQGSPDDAAPLGALLVALSFGSMEDFSKSVFGEHSELGSLQSGLWLKGKIFSKSIPADVAQQLAQRIGQERGTKSKSDGTLALQIGGVPHRAIYRELDPESPIPGIPAYQVGLFSMAEAAGEQARLFHIILASGAFALAGALIAILVLSRGLSKPLHDLVAGTKEIREGNFNVRVKVSGTDELGQLSAAFNEMAKDLALNQKYHTVLTQVADKGIARALMRGEVTLGGELRKVSVLFCDIRGFTSLTEGMPPQEVVHLLNEHMTAMTELVHRYHGVVDKFVGDLIMAIFGAPVARPDDVVNAARCALAMQAARKELNLSSLHRFDTGIGIATGISLVGCMGSIHRLDYTVLGERVNLASRLCGAAAPQEILLDETTVEELGPQALTESLGDLPLKGFTETPRAWRLLEAHGSLPALAAASAQ